jgi:acetyl esterase/lipase
MKGQHMMRTPGILLGGMLLFSSVAAVAAEEARDTRITPDVAYGHKDGMALTFDVFAPAKPNGAGVMFIVSGGWYSRWAPPEQTVNLFRPFLDKGFTLFAIRHGSSPKYLVPEIVEDVRRAVRYIRLHSGEFGVDPDRLGVHGWSAGGHLSLMLGTTGDDGDPISKDEVLRAGDRVAAVAAYFAPTDIVPFVSKDSEYYQRFPALQFDAELADDCSPLFHVTADDPPTLLIHGDKDDLVPLKHSTEIKKAFDEKNVTAELLVIKDAGHGFGGEDGKRAGEATLAWFEKHLLSEKQSR